jgi:hypothetical protein
MTSNIDSCLCTKQWKISNVCCQNRQYNLLFGIKTETLYYHGTTFWQIMSISFVLTQFSTFLPPECLGLFPKYLIHSFIILLHWNLWMDCYVSVKQVLGPPFDKCHTPSQHSKSAKFQVQQQKWNQSMKRVLMRRSEFELVWQMSRWVTLLSVLIQTHL